MARIDDFLQRLAQHVDAQKQRLNPTTQNPAAFVANAFLQPSRGALDTVGLGLEGTGILGQYLAGEASLPLAAAQVLAADNGMLEMDDEGVQRATAASRKAIALGPTHPRAALDELRNSGDPLTSYGAGALAMVLDPANLVGPPVGKAANAAKAAKGAAIAGRTAELSPAFFEDLAQERGLADDAGKAAIARLNTALAAGGLPREAVGNAANVTDPMESFLARLRDKRPLDEIFGIADRAKAAGAAREETGLARQDVAAAGEVYKDVQGQKAAAVREALDEFRVNGRLPRNFKLTPEYATRVDETKNAVELLNPQGPQNRATYGSFVGDRRAYLNQAKAQQATANKELAAAFGDVPRSPITPDQAAQLAGPEALDLAADTSAVQQAVAGGVDPALARQRSQDLGALNARENEFFNSVTPAADVPAPAQVPAPSPLPVAAKTADNPAYLASVRDQATAVANLAPPPGMYPELADPKAGRIIDLINYALKEGLVTEKEAFSRPWKKMGLGDVASVWYGVNIQTVKNLLQDPAFARFVLANEGIAGKAMTDNRRVIVNRLVKGEEDSLALFGTLGDVLVQLGLQTEKNDPKYAAEVMKKLGGNPFDNEAEIAQHLNGMQQALTGLGLQLANPVRGVTGVLTAPLNLLIPMRARMFHIINNVTHVSSRVAAFEQAAFPMLENSAKVLLGRAAAEGKDVTPLLGRGLERGGDVLAREGMFSWQEASKVLGNRYGKEWRAISEQAMDAGYENSRRVLGNYQLDGALGAAEQQIRKVVPLQSWAWRAYPRAAKYALQHPAVTLGLLHLAAAAREEAKQTGMPGYMVGTIGAKVGPDTPFLHLLADVFTPEQEAEIRVNPLSLFTPVGGDVLGMGLETTEPETGYQKAQQLLGATGASFSPLIQEGAYLTGQDYKAPAPGSRYSNIDLLTADLGGPSAPTLANPNKKLRAAVAPMFGADGKDTFDPVVNKANELVLERTGKVISDPSNQALALDLKDHGPFYQEAQRLLDEGGAARSAFNAASPVSVITRTETTANRQAAGDPPYPYDLIKEAKDQGLAATVKMMDAANDQWYKAHPEAAVNKKADVPKESAADPRILAFEQKNAVLKRYAPRAYAAALKDYKETLGIR